MTEYKFNWKPPEGALPSKPFSVRNLILPTTPKRPAWVIDDDIEDPTPPSSHRKKSRSNRTSCSKSKQTPLQTTGKNSFNTSNNCKIHRVLLKPLSRSINSILYLVPLYPPAIKQRKKKYEFHAIYDSDHEKPAIQKLMKRVNFKDDSNSKQLKAKGTARTVVPARCPVPVRSLPVAKSPLPPRPTVA
jgi:hypothetical protein